MGGAAGRVGAAPQGLRDAHDRDGGEGRDQAPEPLKKSYELPAPNSWGRLFLPAAKPTGLVEANSSFFFLLSFS